MEKELRIKALIAVVERETVMIEMDCKRFGEFQTDPVTPSFKELHELLKGV
jgi:hypothetical protein